ncbi:MAG: transporter [Pirellulales bacterium]
MNAAASEILTLFCVVGVGLALGRLSFRGISLGTSGVVFVAMVAGHFGFEVPDLVGAVGIVLFMYCLGVSAGPNFLRDILRQGRALAVMATLMTVAAAGAAWLVARLGNVPVELTSGLFAGALTSTPALAAASDRLPGNVDVAVAFGVAYPIGVIGVIVFVHLAPWLFGISLVDADRRAVGGPSDPITRMLVEVVNPVVVGKRIRDIGAVAHSNCQVSRRLAGSRLEPIPPDFTLQLGDHLLVVGQRSRIGDVVDALGKPAPDADYTLDMERQRRGCRHFQTTCRPIARTSTCSRGSASTISRITRQDVEFVPSAHEKIHFGDVVTVVGEPSSIEAFTAYAGHHERAVDETDLISLVVGLVGGIVLGRIEFAYGGESISLGLAGGPLLMGLIIGHFGKIGPIVGHIPRAARWLTAEVGLAIFLAHAGSRAGAGVAAVVTQYGAELIFGAAVILIVPLLVGYVVARFVLRIDLLEALGGVCGAMTSTPGLGVVAAQVESTLPVTSYATVYPTAIILVTLLTYGLVSLLAG